MTWAGCHNNGAAFLPFISISLIQIFSENNCFLSSRKPQMMMKHQTAQRIHSVLPGNYLLERCDMFAILCLPAACVSCDDADKISKQPFYRAGNIIGPKGEAGLPVAMWFRCHLTPATVRVLPPPMSITYIGTPICWLSSMSGGSFCPPLWNCHCCWTLWTQNEV